MNKEEFIKETKKIGIELNNQILKDLEAYYNILKEENTKYNLTRIISQEDVYLKHFYDSLTLAKVIDLSTKETLCDVGTGAGFPGIVLKIVYPNLKITLVDALQKRVNYLNAIIKDLQLENIQAIHTRGEDLHDKYDVVTARAVANIEKLLKYTMHLVNNTGVFVAMKGNIDNELTPEIENKISKKYQILKIEKFELPIENSQRSLIVVKSISS